MPVLDNTHGCYFSNPSRRHDILPFSTKYPPKMSKIIPTSTSKRTAVIAQNGGKVQRSVKEAIFLLFSYNTAFCLNAK